MSEAHSTSTTQRRFESAERIAPGDIVQGKFRVERIVGRGGMGIVIEATNVQLDQKVALKLLATGAEDPTMVDRFSREARAAARLKSEHVARVYDVGKDTLYGPFIVMEMLDGKTLAELLAEIKRVQLHRAIEYVIDACEGLAEAHARGIVHQDVKPANLFLVLGSDGRPSIKLLDFGIATMRAKTKDETNDGKSSQPSAGTPAYLAPEQLRGSPSIDHRADVWALGCVLFELLTGERAFKQLRFMELVTNILESPRTAMPADLTVPFEVVAAIDRCLEKDPKNRFASTAELALALLPFARRRAHASVARAVAHVKTAGLDPSLEMPSSMPPPPASSQGSIEMIAAASSGSLKAPGVPSFSDQPQAAPSKPALAAAAPSRNRGLPIAILALVIVVLVVGGIVVQRLRAPRTIEARVTPTGSPPATSSTPTVVTVDSVSTPPTPTVADSSPTAAASSVAPTSLPPRFRGDWRPRGPVKTGTSTPPTAPGPTPESEIRHNR